MRCAAAAAVIAVIPAAARALGAPMLSPDFVAGVAVRAHGWVPRREQGALVTAASAQQLRALLGLRHGAQPLRPRPPAAADSVPPAEFDARERWPHCPSIGRIRDQSACGSCWAVAAAAAISDRYCTAGGRADVVASGAYMLSCCEACGNGCQGGNMHLAWLDWVKPPPLGQGLVNASCWAYPFDACGHHVSGGAYPECPPQPYSAPACPFKFDTSGEPVQPACPSGEKWAVLKGAEAYTLQGEAAMKAEVAQHGPFEAGMTVYPSFYAYGGGVYAHLADEKAEGLHAVKVVGYGAMNGTQYWLIANSWNSDWGDRGFFKILRGADECGIESSKSVAGMP